MRGWYSPIFFLFKNIETGRTRYRVSTEHTQGASLGGWMVGNERTVQSFIRSLDGVSERT